MNLTFLKDFNSNLPSVSEIAYQYKNKSDIELDEEKSELFLKRMTLINTNNFKVKSKLEYLIYNTNIGNIGVGSIYFYSEFERLQDGVSLFADFKESQFFFGIYDDEKIFFHQEGIEKKEDVFENEGQFIDFLLFYHKTHYDIFYRGIKPDSNKLSSFILLDKSEYIISEIFNELPNA